MDNIASSPIQNTPTPVVPTTPRPGVTAETPTDEAVSIFEQVHQMPYSAKHFGISKSQYFALKQADITDLSPKMSAIDNYVREKITSDKYIDSTSTYTQMMNEIKSVLGIKDYETPASQIEKIFLYITNGKGMDRQYRVKRSSNADTIDHAQNQAMKSLRKQFPNKTQKLRSIFNTFTQ